MEGKKFFIFGYGISNKVAADKLIELGASVTLDDDDSDKIPGNYHKLSWNKADFSGYDYLLLTPGVPFCCEKKHPIVDQARAHNLSIIGDIELFYLLNPEATYIGITGTNGKSTTSSLIYHLLKSKGKNVYFGGNIGEPVLSFPLESDAYYVFELSSFQLDLLDKMEVDYALILNITPDHLDRYLSFSHYEKQKYRICGLQKKSKNNCFIFKDQCNFKSHESDLKVGNKVISLSVDGKDKDFYVRGDVVCGDGMEVQISADVSLQIGHKQNLVAAIAIVSSLGVGEAEIIKLLPSFKSLEHRLELVAKYKNIQIFNDSKATNAESTKNALDNFDNIFWLAGGIAKEGGIEELKPCFNKITKAFLFGDASDLFADQIGDKTCWQKYSDFSTAVYAAFIDALKEENMVNLILSPACSSFDMFANYAARGRAFKKLVQQIIENEDNAAG